MAMYEYILAGWSRIRNDNFSWSLFQVRRGKFSKCLILKFLVLTPIARTTCSSYRFGAVGARRTPFWDNVIVTLNIKNIEDEVFSSYMGEKL